MPLGVMLDTASRSSPLNAFPCHQPNLESPTSILQPLQEAAQFLKGPKPLWAPPGTSANPKSSFGVPQASPSLAPSPSQRGAELCAIWAGGRAPHPCPLRGHHFPIWGHQMCLRGIWPDTGGCLPCRPCVQWSHWVYFHCQCSWEAKRGACAKQPFLLHFQLFSKPLIRRPRWC